MSVLLKNNGFISMYNFNGSSLHSVIDFKENSDCPTAVLLLGEDLVDLLLCSDVNTEKFLSGAAILFMILNNSCKFAA